MLELFYLLGYGQLTFTRGLPVGFKGPFIAGGQSFHFSTESGPVVVQEVRDNAFSLQFISLDFVKKETLFGALGEGLYSFFGYSGEVQFSFSKQTKLRQGQFLFNKGQGKEWKITVQKNKPVHILKISFGPELTDDLMPVFPLLQELSSDARHLTAGPFSADADIREVIRKMLYAAYEPYKLSIYFKTKISEYLFLLLEKAANTEPVKDLIPTAWEQEAIFKIRDFVIADVTQHHSIPALAKRYKINPVHFKIFFKREFGAGPYTFLLNARLDKIRELMEQGMPMKEAAPMAGYQTTSFITAFKKRFGYPPGALFRKKRG